jgi:hypothetical protein
MIGLAFYVIAVLTLIGERLFIAYLALAALCLLAAAAIAWRFTRTRGGILPLGGVCMLGVVAGACLTVAAIAGFLAQ